MNRPILILTTILFSLTGSMANELVLNLKGFQLGQYREVARNELGRPFQEHKYKDRFESEIYLLNPDTSLYMIFEYAPNNLEVIWSIQLTGKSSNTDFKNLNLGMDKGEVEKALGIPSRRISIGEYGEKWEYDKTNYSVEVSTKGKLSSIKITDDSYEMFPKVDITKLPAFDYTVKVLKSGSNQAIKEILAPDIEIYTGDTAHFFRNRVADEISNDKSGIFRLIRKLVKTLETVNTKDLNEYEENVRLREGRDPLHVIKIKREGQSIKEIVFTYHFGKYLIWEIKT